MVIIVTGGQVQQMNRDTPVNRSSCSRHKDADLSLQGKRLNRVVPLGERSYLPP